MAAPKAWSPVVAARRAVKNAAFRWLATGQRRRPLQPILILGHMRAGSTLLCHLLMAHRDILGMGERNAVYRTGRDLDALAVQARWTRRRPFRHYRYAVDQVNHNRLTPCPGLLADALVRCIVLVREPPASAASIVGALDPIYGGWSPERAMAYCAERLEGLAELCRHAPPGRLLALRYEDLVGQTETALARVDAFLGLAEPLKAAYALHPFTGRRGDPSATIRSGRVVQPPARPPVAAPPALEARAQTAYRALWRQLEADGRAAEM